MPRKNLYRSTVLPYHITARVNNREIFPLPLDRMWKVISFETWHMSLIFGLEVHVLVIMPNHVHMIATVPEFDLGIVMNQWMSNITKATNALSGKSGHLFGGPYYWSIIESSRYFGHALKYVYRNPVKAGLCARVEQYPHSTLHGLLGFAYLPVPIFYSRSALEFHLPTPGSVPWLEWLNQPFSKEVDELIGKGLKRKFFKQYKDEKTKKIFRDLEIIQ